MKEPPFRTVPTFVPCYQYVFFLADQGEKLFQVVEPDLHFSLLSLAPASEHYSQLRESRDHRRNEVRFKHVTEVEVSSTCSVSMREHSHPPIFYPE